MFEIDLTKAGLLTNLRSELGSRVGKISPSKAARLEKKFISPTLQIPAELDTLVRIFTEAEPQIGLRKGSPLEIALQVSRAIAANNFDSLSEVLTGIRFSPEAFVAGFDATRGLISSLSDLAAAYQDVSEGSDIVAVDVLRSINKAVPVGSTGPDDEDRYLWIVNRSRTMTRLLIADPTGKSVVAFGKEVLEKDTPNLDATKGAITRFALIGHNFACNLYGRSYDTAVLQYVDSKIRIS